MGRKTPENLKKYLTSEIIHSRYKVLPEINMVKKPIFLNNNYFYALSWIIVEPGKLKDSGLRVKLVGESLHEVYDIKRDIRPFSYSLCGENQMKIPVILSPAQNIAGKFFDQKILENLLTK